MKKYLYLTIFLPIFSFGQVGIFTNNPLETLHIGGDSSEVMVKGLNAVNNVNNYGGDATSRVFVNSDGDLVLGESRDNVRLILDVPNYIPDDREVKVVQTGTGSNYTLLYPQNHTFPSFTMAEDGILEINYSISWTIVKNNPNNVDDNGARTVQTIAYIYDHATGTYINDAYALTGQFYSNGDSTKGARTGFFNTGTDYAYLPAGTYTIIFGGLVGAFGNSNIFAFFGGDNDQLQLVAYY